MDSNVCLEWIFFISNSTWYQYVTLYIMSMCIWRAKFFPYYTKPTHTVICKWWFPPMVLTKFSGNTMDNIVIQTLLETRFRLIWGSEMRETGAMRHLVRWVLHQNEIPSGIPWMYGAHKKHYWFVRHDAQGAPQQKWFGFVKPFGADSGIFHGN